MHAINDVINRQIGGRLRRGAQILGVGFSRFQQRFRLHQTHRRQQHNADGHPSRNDECNGGDDDEDDERKAANGNLSSNSSISTLLTLDRRLLN